MASSAIRIIIIQTQYRDGNRRRDIHLPFNYNIAEVKVTNRMKSGVFIPEIFFPTHINLKIKSRCER